MKKINIKDPLSEEEFAGGYWIPIVEALFPDEDTFVLVAEQRNLIACYKRGREDAVLIASLMEYMYPSGRINIDVLTRDFLLMLSSEKSGGGVSEDELDDRIANVVASTIPSLEQLTASVLSNINIDEHANITVKYENNATTPAPVAKIILPSGEEISQDNFSEIGSGKYRFMFDTTGNDGVHAVEICYR